MTTRITGASRPAGSSAVPRPSASSAVPRPAVPPGTTDHPIEPHDIVDYPRPKDGLPEITDTPENLRKVAHRLAGGQGPVAVDAERASGFRYGQDAYLVQLRRDGAGTFLIDPVTCGPLTELAAALDGPEWILHAADQDIPCLAALGLTAVSLFDTELAARLLGRQHVGLGAVIEETLGLRLAKDHAAADWSTRPLPASWLIYAALDVELLTELYYRLSKRLDEMGRWEWAQQEFAHALSVTPPAPKPDRWRSVPGAGKIRSRRGLAVLKALWETRESIAQRIDLSPGRLVRNAALVRAASNPPRNRRALMSISEFRSPVARQYEDEWMRALASVAAMTDDELPPKRKPVQPGSIPEPRQWNRIDEASAARLGTVRNAVASVASSLGLAPEVVLAPQVQRYLAWAPLDPSRPSGDEVEERMVNRGARDWQIDLTLDPICDALGV